MCSNELRPVHSDEQGLQGESPPSRVPIEIDAKRNLAEGIKDIDGLQKKVEGLLFKDSEEKWDYITINKLRAHLREEVEKRKGDLTFEEEKAAARVGVAVGGGGARGSEDLAVSKLALETVSLDLKKVTERLNETKKSMAARIRDLLPGKEKKYEGEEEEVMEAKSEVKKEDEEKTKFLPPIDEEYTSPDNSFDDEDFEGVESELSMSLSPEHIERIMQGLDPEDKTVQLKSVNNNKYGLGVVVCGLGSVEEEEEEEEEGGGMKKRILWADEEVEEEGIVPVAPASPYDGILRESLPSSILSKILTPPPVPPPSMAQLNIPNVTPTKAGGEEGGEEEDVPSPIANDETDNIDIEVEEGDGLIERGGGAVGVVNEVDFLSPPSEKKTLRFMKEKKKEVRVTPKEVENTTNMNTPPRSGKKPPLSPYSTGPSKKVIKAQKKIERKFNKYLQTHTTGRVVVTPEGGAKGKAV
ncbi:hypothetical protein TL16_g12549 [Triparma laevis f. inornata]|uniref:Uncharacterized protein n=1 Tax=Triparma laevis f. inornata TaxID=1714386 RepID=A0A9W7EWT1_9STRA|nr:hypothetical protein TL16_g12549 [Triparma laevis f. inornata]